MPSFLMKGQFKDEFVTAGGVPLSEVTLSLSLSLSLSPSYTHTHCKYDSGFLAFMKIMLNTMESKLHSHLYFAGEVVLLGTYLLSIHNICNQ